MLNERVRFSLIVICVASIAYYQGFYFRNFTGLSGLLLQVGHIWVGRRCRWIHKEKSSIWTSMETYLSFSLHGFTFMSMVQKLGIISLSFGRKKFLGGGRTCSQPGKVLWTYLVSLPCQRWRTYAWSLIYFSYSFIGSYRLWSNSHRDHQYLLQIKLPQLHVSGRKVKKTEEIIKDAWEIYWCFHFCQSFLCLRRVTYWMLVLQQREFLYIFMTSYSNPLKFLPDV